jgi:glycosyltransferase involved in cell wall biosynthesis
MLIPVEKLHTCPVRVLLLNQVFHPDPQATSQYLSRLAEELARRGHQLTVLTARRDYDQPAQRHPARETWRGIDIVRVWNTGLGSASALRRAVDFLTFHLSALLRGLFLPRPDVVVALTTPPLVSVLGAILAARWKARFVYWVMDLNPDQVVAIGWLKPDTLAARFLETASRWSLNRADRIIVLDRYMRERLFAKGVPAQKIDVIPLWTQSEVSFDAAGRERFRREHKLENKFVVMHAGNHTPCHPLDTLLRAAELLRDDPRIHFCFVGGGGDWPRLRNRAREEHWGAVTFLGYLPFDQLPALLSAADLQVVVLGDPFVGITHPCKAYNFLGAQRPFIYVGPDPSHIADLIRQAGLEKLTASFRHGEAPALAAELRRLAQASANCEKLPPWPEKDRTDPWSEAAILQKVISVLEP